MEPYIGEIRIFAGNFAPVGWLYCQGQLLSIAEYDTLFNLIGTTYGGDGQTTFGLPDLRSRVVVGQGRSAAGTNYAMGMAVGQEGITLNNNTLAQHTHPFTGQVQAVAGGRSLPSPTNAYFGDQGAATYTTTAPGAQPGTLGPGALRGQSSPAGGSLPHPNIQPVLATSYIIATEGVYPPQN